MFKEPFGHNRLKTKKRKIKRLKINEKDPPINDFNDTLKTLDNTTEPQKWSPLATAFASDIEFALKLVILEKAVAECLSL